MAEKPETRFKKKVLETLRLRYPKISAWEKIQQVSLHGTPDIIGCLRGRMVAIELKTDVGVVDPLQSYKLFRWRLAGALTFIMTPASFDNDLAELELFVKNTP